MQSPAAFQEAQNNGKLTPIYKGCRFLVSLRAKSGLKTTETFSPYFSPHFSPIVAAENVAVVKKNDDRMFVNNRVPNSLDRYWYLPCTGTYQFEP